MRARYRDRAAKCLTRDLGIPLGLVALLLISPTQPAVAGVYNFEQLELRVLAGQDGWLAEPYGGEALVRDDDTAVNGTRIVLPYLGLVGGFTGYYTRVNNAAFGFSLASANQLIIQFDSTGAADTAFGLGTDVDGNGLLERSTSELGPAFGLSRDTNISVAQFVIYPSGFGAPLKTSLTSGNNPGDWYRLQLRIDLIAGTGSLFFLNQSRGDSVFQAVPGLQNVDLGLDTLQAAARPETWNAMWLMMEADGRQSTPKVDNLIPTSGGGISARAAVGGVELNHNWQRVSFSQAFANPVVIAGPPSFKGSDPTVVRMNDVAFDGFDVRLQEWAYLDGSHVNETLSYLVANAGRITLSDGTMIEAGTFVLSGTGVWSPKAFQSPFGGVPALYLTVQTFNGSQPVTVRARGVGVAGFEAALFEEEALMDGHVPETVGYLAVYKPNGWGSVELDDGQEPYLLQRLMTDHRWAETLSHTLRLEEEQSLDPEVGHLDETLDVLVVGEHLFAQPVSFNGADTFALRRLSPEYTAKVEWGVVDGVTDAWRRVPLAKDYSKPVVVAKPASSRGADQGVVRIQAAVNNSFQLRFQEWDYLDGVHIAEQIFYLVAEAGSHSLAGLQLKAGRVDTDALARLGGWAGAQFSAPFAAAPAVFTAVNTNNGGDAVTTRVRAVDASGFDVAMDEQESKLDGHVVERIGWIAIDQASGTTADGRKVLVFTDAVDHVSVPILFGTAVNRRFPVVLGDANSYFGPDPFGLRYRGVTASEIELWLEEEQSWDTETSHVLEDTAIFVAE